MAHDRRRVLHFNVTEHPTASWAAQQIIEMFPEQTGPRFLLRDRDQIYGEEFRRRVVGMKIEEVITTTRSHWQKCFRRKTDRFDPPQVFGSRDRFRRKPSPPNFEKLIRLLSSFQDAFILV
jgi:hypothetical protein